MVACLRQAVFCPSKPAVELEALSPTSTKGRVKHFDKNTYRELVVRAEATVEDHTQQMCVDRVVVQLVCART